MNQSLRGICEGTHGGTLPAATVERLPTTAALFRFLQLSGLSFLLNLGTTIVLHEVFKVPAELAYAAALLTVLATNFAVMRWYVFPQSGQPLVRQAGSFAATSVLFRGCEYLAFLLLHSLLGLAYVTAIVLVTALAFLSKFLFYRQWVFAPRSALNGQSASL